MSSIFRQNLVRHVTPIVGLLLSLSANMPADTLVSLGGTLLGFTAGTQTVGWLQESEVNDVQIFAGLESGNTAPSNFTFYLTQEVGVPNAANTEVGISTGTLPPYPFGQPGPALVSLFQGLTLMPGQYWLTLYAPSDYVSWDVCQPCVPTEQPTSQYLASGYAPTTAGYPPSSQFLFPTYRGLEFLVTGEQVAPEPAHLGLAALLLLFLFAVVRLKLSPR